MKLLKLNLNAFRGATQPFELDFDSKKKMTMIFGENGCGKSTIADAFTCLCTNNLGSIQDKSGSDKRYLASANGKVSDTKIELTTDLGNFSTTFSGSAFNKNTSTTYPTLRHLRRSQIVKLVDAQPAKRYDELKDYIDVDSIANSEAGLKNLINSLIDEFNSQVRTLAESTSTIENTWNNEGKPLGDWRTWAKAESLKDVKAEQGQIKAIEDFLKFWESVNSKIQQIQSQEASLLSSTHSLIAVQKELEAVEMVGDQMDGTLLSILDHAKNHITKHEGTTLCPLCEQAIDRTSLLNSIQARLDSNKELKELSRKKEQAIREETNAKSFLQSSKNQLDILLLALGEKVGTLFSLEIDFKKAEFTPEKRFELFSSSKSAIESTIAELVKKKEQSERTIAQKNLIKTPYERILQFEVKVKETELLLQTARKAHEIVESSRKDYVEQELVSISGEVDLMYQQLHPNENIGSIKLSVKPNVRQSVELSGSFQHLTDIAPQSLYSESHLDTLGICVFLALAKKYGNASTILVLDDVVMSVDANHLDRFISLLHDIAGNFAHVIITTHYRPWRDRYRYGRAPASEVHFVELRTWKIASGMRLQYGKNQIQELKEAIDNPQFDRQNVAGKAGILLENILDYLTLNYGCRVRRKPGNDYTLGELLDGTAKLSKHLKVERLTKNTTTGQYDATQPITETMLGTYLEDLKAISFIRNQVGAHFNLSGSSVSDTEIEEFAEKTYDLAVHLTCPDSGAFPDRKDSGSYHETKSKSLRLHPFQEPLK